MRYRKADVYPSRSSGGRIQPTILVLHTTEGYGRAYLDRLFSGRTRRDDEQKISVHWCIYTDGEVVEYAPWKPGEAVRCIHAGASSWRGRPACNTYSLGCEIEHVAGDPYPTVVVEALIELLRIVKAAYPTMELVTHADIAPGRKVDPTAPWDDIKQGIYDAWEGDDMTPDEVRAIVREEIERVYSSDVDEAQELLVKQGLLSKARPKHKIASIGYVDLMLARVLQRCKG